MAQSDSLRIRKAQAADADHIAAFNRAMASETEGKTLIPELIAAGVRRLLAEPALGFYAVAEHEGEVVGCLMVTNEWSDWRNGWWWWIQSVYVAPEARRSGVFRALYVHVETQARDTPGVCGLRLYVEKDNARAQATYAALGMLDARYRVFEAAVRRD